MTEQKTNVVALVDLSSIAYPAYMTSSGNADPDAASQAIIDRVRNITAAYPQAAICVDSGSSFRKSLDGDYKANRPEKEAVLYHQIDRAIDQLLADQYPIWKVAGMEADDVIASATKIALGLADTNVLIFTSDKDLFQLINDRVTVVSLISGVHYDESEVGKKFGVTPSQMRDFLTLVGDKADNITGAKGIGAVKAADLLNQYGSLENIFQALAEKPSSFKPAMATSLKEFETRATLVRTLVQLKDDLDLPFADLDKPRSVPQLTETTEPEPATAPEPAPVQETVAAVATVVGVAETLKKETPEAPSQALVPAPVVDVLPPADPDWKKHLEPRSIREAKEVANYMHQSRLFSGYGSPQAVLSTIMAGRELGLQSIASLRGIHLVEGKHTLAADLIRALCLKSGLAKYFRCTERTNEACTFETQRQDDPPMSLRYTIQEAMQAGLVKNKSGWEKNPADMLVARAGSKLARLVYPEVVHGLYSPDEF